MGSINYRRNNIITLGYNIPKKEEEAKKMLLKYFEDQSKISFYND